MVTDEALKNALTGLEKGSVLTLNIFQLFNNNDTVISNTLGIPKEGVNDLNSQLQRNVVVAFQAGIDAELALERVQHRDGDGHAARH